MLNLVGKSLIFTDLHIGLKNDSLSRLSIINKVILELITAINKNDVKNIIFLGDLFHSRSFLNVNTINVALEIVRTLASAISGKFVLIVGNHDIYYKSKTDVNSVKIFESIPNVVIVDTKLEALLNGQNALFVAWEADLSDIPDNHYNYVFGHFNVSSQYLIKSYISENKSKKLSAQKITLDLIERGIQFVNCEEVSKIIKETDKSNKSSSEDLRQYFGSYIDKALEKGGKIYSGHIHSPKTFRIKGRYFEFVGCPYEQTFADIGLELGYLIFDENNSSKKFIISGTPKHIIIKLSDILALMKAKNCKVREALEEFSITSNIIKLIIDEDCDKRLQNEIIDIIASLNPYDEAPTEYTVIKQNFSCIDEVESNLVDSIKTSKRDYIFEYIKHLNDDDLKSKNVKKSKLYEMFDKYIKLLSEENH